MQISTFFAIYFVVWWLCLFLVLPFGVRNQVDAGEYVQGTEPGAPIKARLGRIALITTALSIPLTAVLMWLLSAQWLQDYWK